MKTVETEAAPRAIGPYSQAVVHEGLVFTSGQIGLEPANGKMKPGGAAEQAGQVFRNLAAVLEAAGSGLDRVVKATVFLKDMTDFEAVNRVYAAHLAHRPARSTLAVAGLPRGALVEIECVALTG